jgi:hypothetical protein
VRGRRGGSLSVRRPGRARQIERLGAAFQALGEALRTDDGARRLREDPHSLAPERVLVFETAGSIENLKSAIDKVSRFDLLVESDEERDADEDFVVVEKRTGQDDKVRFDKPVPGRLYLAMPSIESLRRLVQFWTIWQSGGRLPKGYRPFAQLFEQLRSLRPWGPEDRVSEESIEFWRALLEEDPNELIRVEIEFWYFNSQIRRERADIEFRRLIDNSGGQVVRQAEIREISYRGALVDIPRAQVQTLVERGDVQIALIDSVMFLRPQSLLLTPIEVEPIVEQILDDSTRPNTPDLPPIAALLDGVPIASHVLLRDRLVLDDPDDFESRVLVSARRHGTAMASLILHDDLNVERLPLPRRLYVRPLLRPSPSAGSREVTDPDQLVLDVVHQAVARMKGNNGTAQDVFLVNLSIADPSRPFTGLVSPLARLIDYLSYKYNLLFLVSGGNVEEPLEIPDYPSWTSFEDASEEDRERAVIRAMNLAKWKRTIFSPAESINALTIGGHHHDNVNPRRASPFAIDPLHDPGLPNITSGLGLGYKRAIKPELYFPGGREHVRFDSSANGLSVTAAANQSSFGLKAAAPDPTGLGRLNYLSLTTGTSAVTALATRAAHLIFDSIQTSSEIETFAELEKEYFAVVVKALLVHRARWPSCSSLIRGICGPDGGSQHLEQSENAARFLGYGIPEVTEALDCDSNRATLVGFGSLSSLESLSFSFPLPACLESVTHPRSLAITLAWLSPIGSPLSRYKQARLEVTPLGVPQQLGVMRVAKEQPEPPTALRGTVFHARYAGNRAVPFIEDGHIALNVSRKNDPVGPGTIARFGIAVTIESEVDIPIYDQIRNRLRVATTV